MCLVVKIFGPLASKLRACVDIQSICSDTCLIGLHSRLIREHAWLIENLQLVWPSPPSAILCGLNTALLRFFHRFLTPSSSSALSEVVNVDAFDCEFARCLGVVWVTWWSSYLSCERLAWRTSICVPWQECRCINEQVEVTRGRALLRFGRGRSMLDEPWADRLRR